MRIALGNDDRPASDAEVVDFLRSAVHRRIDTTALWVAEQGGRLASAILPLSSPGRTLLLLCPGGSRRPAAATPPLIRAVCDHYRDRGIQLAQALIDPSAVALANVFRDLAFQQMADLLYMQRTVRGDTRFPPSIGVSYVPYRPENDQAFRDTILATYEGSLDCPALNGVRSIDDIMAGHRATGEFDPTLWTLIHQDNRAVGVTLLSPQRFADAVELVYFGLVPEARGRGIGNIAMQHVLNQVSRSGLSRVSLAVDAINLPAIRLYTRAGLSVVGSKLAFLKQLRSALQPA